MYSSWPYRIFAMLFTFVLVNVGMLLFRANGVWAAWHMLVRIFYSPDSTAISHAYIRSYDIIISCVGLAVVAAVDIMTYKKIDLSKFLLNHTVVRYVVYTVLFAVIVFIGAYGSGYGYIDPIYGGF